MMRSAALGNPDDPYHLPCCGIGMRHNEREDNTIGAISALQEVLAEQAIRARTDAEPGGYSEERAEQIADSDKFASQVRTMAAQRPSRLDCGVARLAALPKCLGWYFSGTLYVDMFPAEASSPWGFFPVCRKRSPVIRPRGIVWSRPW